MQILNQLLSGFADIETRQTMTTKSRMLAASIGKTFVAATVVALAKETLDKSCFNLEANFLFRSSFRSSVNLQEVSSALQTRSHDENR